MPKPSQPSPLPLECDEDPVWGDLFGFVSRTPPNPAPTADTPTPAPSLQRRQQPNTPRKPSTKRPPPGRAGDS